MGLEDTPSPKKPEWMTGKITLTPDEVEAMRRATQARIMEKQTEKTAKENLEKKTYLVFSKYIIGGYLVKFSEIYTEAQIDGDRINIQAAQAALEKKGKEKFPICPLSSKEIGTLKSNHEISIDEIPLTMISKKNVVIITSDGIIFEARISHANTTMSLIRYIPEQI